MASNLPELVMPEHAVDHAAASNQQTIDFLQIALQNWKLIAFGAFLGLLLGIAAYLFSGPDYKATVRVMVQRSSQTAINPNQRVKAFSDRAEHIPIIKSAKIMRPAVETSKLDELESLKGNDTLVSDLADDIVVIRSAGSEISLINIFDITYTSKHADDAVKIVEAVASAYGEWLREDHSKHTEQIMADVLKAEVELNTRLATKEKAYTDWVSKSDHLVWKRPERTARVAAR